MAEAFKETLGMWWVKIILPIIFAILSGVVVYFYHHEVRTDEIEQDLALLKVDTARNRTETGEYLAVLREIATGVQANEISIREMRARNDAIIQRNNQMIEALIDKAEGEVAGKQ